MRLIGLTGGIASGKSTVAALLAARGAELVDADQLARDVVQPGQPALRRIAEQFGEGMLRADGTLDRSRLGALVFADADARRRLERITHPRIALLMQERIARGIARDAPVVVLDIPLLFENHREDDVEGVLLVWVPRQIQVDRLLQRDGLSEREARQRIEAQLPLDQKRERATWIIDNSGSLQECALQVQRWWDEEIGGGR